NPVIALRDILLSIALVVDESSKLLSTLLTPISIEKSRPQHVFIMTDAMSETEMRLISDSMVGPSLVRNIVIVQNDRLLRKMKGLRRHNEDFEIVKDDDLFTHEFPGASVILFNLEKYLDREASVKVIAGPGITFNRNQSELEFELILVR